MDAWDTVFVRARRRDLHPILADVAGWWRWWPGVFTEPAGEQVRVRLRPPGPGARPQRLTVRVVRDRPDLGIDLAYRGHVDGEAEFYYLDEPAGTVVHYLLRGDVAGRRWQATLRSHRAAVRRALNALKDRMEAGRPPGEEPSACLLADQREATAQFQAGVAAWRARQAADGE